MGAQGAGVAATPMLVQQQNVLLGRLIDELATANRLALDQRALAAATFLTNSAVALDLLQQLGFANLEFFNATAIVPALATATVFTLTVPGNSVGFWRDLTVTPDTSNQFTMQVLADSQQIINDPSLVARVIIPESQWLPFYTSFSVKLTNNDAVAPHSATIIGARAFLQTRHWQRIRAALDAALQAVVGDRPYPSGVR